MKVCVLASGSKGNATYISTESTKILIDIGATSLYVENVAYEEEVEGDIEECEFQKINFCGEDVILYDTLRGSIGLIQDTPVAPWEDYAEGVYEDLVQEGEYKIFIKT